MMSTALGSSKPLSNPCLILFGFFSLVLADTNRSTAAAAAQPSDMNSHGYFILPFAVDTSAVTMIAAGGRGP
jgi:hypothetical protein